jgi:putative membrane protein
MQHYFWNDWYLGWGWFLWVGMMVLFFSSMGNWRYSYAAHRKYDRQNPDDAIDILNQRYARSEITRDEFVRMKSDIANTA